jgi:hypothetical protein
MNNTVAQTILEQIGGRRFLMMTGAKNLTSRADGLSMVLPDTRYGKSRVSVNGTIFVFAVILSPMDDYTLRLCSVKNFESKVIEEVQGVYCDQLEDIFTSMTGLYTRL